MLSPLLSLIPILPDEPVPSITLHFIYTLFPVSNFCVVVIPFQNPLTHCNSNTPFLLSTTLTSDVDLTFSVLKMFSLTISTFALPQL